MTDTNTKRSVLACTRDNQCNSVHVSQNLGEMQAVSATHALLIGRGYAIAVHSLLPGLAFQWRCTYSVETDNGSRLQEAKPTQTSRAHMAKLCERCWACIWGSNQGDYSKSAEQPLELELRWQSASPSIHRALTLSSGGREHCLVSTEPGV